MRRTYWSCTKFADWIRGTKKLKYGTIEEWNAWESQAKEYNPIRCWIAEEGLDHLQKVVMWVPDKIHSVKYYINNRWITRTHSLTASPRDIEPGKWCDLGSRFLPCLFNELVNFVEIELAWFHLAWSDRCERAKYNMPWWAVGWWRIRTWRCPQAGIDNLEWQRNLVWTENDLGEGHELVGKPTPQAELAEEILALYKWWTETYKNRPDPYDASGWSECCDDFFQKNEDPAFEKRKDTSHRLLEKIEAEYEKEDTEMMIRLIKIRNALWT